MEIVRRGGFRFGIFLEAYLLAQTKKEVILKMQNYLKAVFWDYPEFSNENDLIKSIPQPKENIELRRWFMYRFLENGRAIDAVKYFSLKEISENLHYLKVSDYTRDKWNWIINMYGNN